MIVKPKKSPAKPESKRAKKGRQRSPIRKPLRRTKKPLTTKKSTTMFPHQTARVMSMKEEIMEMKIAGYAQYDMAQHLGISEGRVSQLVKEVLQEKTAQLAETVDQYRTMELERINRQILAWHMKARIDARASDVYLSWVERRHKLLGLEINRTEISGRNGGAISISASQINLSLLDDEELV